MDTYQIRTVQELIKGNPYVGRGIVMGLTPDGTHAVAAYFIMGRSQNSRNRVFTVKDGEVFTEPFDLSKRKRGRDALPQRRIHGPAGRCGGV